jgi:integrase
MTGARPFKDKGEISRLLGEIRGRYAKRDAAMIVLAKRTALRISELLSISIGDVFDGRKFRESVLVRRRHTKGKREGRRLPLHREAKLALARWLIELRRDGVALDARRPIFVSRQGGGWQAIGRKMAYRIITSAATRANLPDGISCHSTRKYAAQEVYRLSGNCLVRTGAILGHRGGVATTWRYIRSVATGAESLLLDIA